MTELQFDEATHTYTYDGNVVAGVTETIKSLGPDYDAFFTEEARERGTLVHALTAVMDGRDDLWPEMPEGREDELAGYCDAWHKFKCESKASIYHEFTELPVFHRLYRYAGTIDRVVEIGDSRYVLDIKTGSYDDTHILQLAAYFHGFCSSIDDRVHGAMAVYLRANGTFTTRYFDTKTLNGAFKVFLALRSIAEWHKEHGPPAPPPQEDWVPLPDDAIFEL